MENNIDQNIEKIENDNVENELEQIVETQRDEKDLLIKDESSKNDKNFIKIHKRAVIIFAIVVAVLIIAYFCKGFFVVATIDGAPISRFSIINKLEKQSGKSLLDSVITEKVLQNEIKAKKIVISDDDVNAEIKKIEDQIKSQGDTLESALSQEGMTIDELKKQIKLQKSMESLLSGKVTVSDEEVDAYIKENNVSLQKGQEDQMKSQIKQQLVSQKMSTEAQSLIQELKSKAKIKYFVKY